MTSSSSYLALLNGLCTYLHTWGHWGWDFICAMPIILITVIPNVSIWTKNLSFVNCTMMRSRFVTNRVYSDSSSIDNVHSPAWSRSGWSDKPAWWNDSCEYIFQLYTKMGCFDATGIAQVESDNVFRIYVAGLIDHSVDRLSQNLGFRISIHPANLLNSKCHRPKCPSYSLNVELFICNFVKLELMLEAATLVTNISSAFGQG